MFCRQVLVFTRLGPGVFTLPVKSDRELPPVVELGDRYFALRVYELPLEDPIAQAWMGWGKINLWLPPALSMYAYVEVAEDDIMSWHRLEYFYGPESGPVEYVPRMPRRQVQEQKLTVRNR